MLALQYRPRRLSDFCGQSHVRLVVGEMLRRYVQDGWRNVPPGMIFTGPRGAGKTSMARVLAAGLNCEQLAPDRVDGREPCGVCVACVAVYDQTSGSVIEVDGATSASVDDVRQLKQLARLSHPGRYRVIIVDECHALSPQAWSALLKQLEEPPLDVVYVLVTTDFRQLPETIVSRCLVFRFAPVSEQDIRDRLRFVSSREGFILDDRTLALMARRAKGAVRDALMLLDQLAIVGDMSHEQAQTLWLGDVDAFASAFLASVEHGDEGAALRLIRSAYFVHRDVLDMLDAIVRTIGDQILEAVTQGGSAAIARSKRLGALLVSVWQTRLLMRSAAASDSVPLEMLWFVLRAEWHGAVDKATVVPPRPEPPTTAPVVSGLARLKGLGVRSG